MSHVGDKMKIKFETELSDKDIYNILSQNRYKKNYDELDNTQKFVIEIDWDRFCV